jgi:hypothetical protein
MPTALITMAGGINIFASLKQSWTSVSWEQVVAAKPQCIIINNYGSPTAAQKGHGRHRPLAAPNGIRPARRRLINMELGSAGVWAGLPHCRAGQTAVHGA